MLRLAIVVGVIALATPAVADDDETVAQFEGELAGHHLDRAARLLAPKVALDGLWFDGACKRFGKPGQLADRDRSAFVGCLEALAPSSTSRHHGATTGAILVRGGVALGITVRDRQITALGFVDRDRTDAAIPTVFRVADRIAAELAVSDAVRATIDATPTHRVAATWKTCLDARGKITHTRLVGGSGVAEFDAAARHAIDGYTFEAVELDGHRVAVCEVIRFELDARPSAPPPDATRPTNVPPAALEPLRVRGDRTLAPDAATRRAMAKAKLARVTGSWKVCFDATGAFVASQVLKSTGVAAFDATVAAALARWGFKPYLVNGTPGAVCTVASVAYGN